MRAWLQRRRRRQAAILVAGVMTVWVQNCVQRAAEADRAGLPHSPGAWRAEAVDLAHTLRRLEIELTGEELTIWLGDL